MNKFLHYVPGVVLALSGCTSTKSPEVSDQGYRISYIDTNRDGHIDRVDYKWSGYDGDYSYQDTDFDGRYDTCMVYGYGVSSKPVDVPVYLDAGKKTLNRSFLSPP